MRPIWRRLRRQHTAGKSPLLEGGPAAAARNADRVRGAVRALPNPESDPPEHTHGPAREVRRVSVRYVVGFAHYNAEEVADRGEAGRLQRRRWHRYTVRSGQLPGGSGAGYHRRMVAQVEGAPRGRVDAHVRHEPGQDQLAAGCFA